MMSNTPLLISITTLALLAGLCWGVLSDMREHRIPNWLVAAVLVNGIVAQLASHGWIGILHAALGLAAGIVFFIPFYVRGAMGAGDVKLMGAAGSTFGGLGALLAGGFTLAAGFVLALLALAWRSTETHRLALSANFAWLPTPQGAGLIVEKGGRLRVPYAGAIACGATLTLWYRGQLSALTGLIT